MGKHHETNMREGGHGMEMETARMGGWMDGWEGRERLGLRGERASEREWRWTWGWGRVDGDGDGDGDGRR